MCVILFYASDFNKIYVFYGPGGGGYGHPPGTALSTSFVPQNKHTPGTQFMTYLLSQSYVHDVRRLISGLQNLSHKLVVSGVYRCEYLCVCVCVRARVRARVCVCVCKLPSRYLSACCCYFHFSLILTFELEQSQLLLDGKHDRTITSHGDFLLLLAS